MSKFDIAWLYYAECVDERLRVYLGSNLL